MRFTVTAEIDSQDSKSLRFEYPRLFVPAFFVEPSAVCEHYALVSRSVKIGINQATIFGGKRNGCLRGGSRRQQHQANNHEHTHAANIALKQRARSRVASAVKTAGEWEALCRS